MHFILKYNQVALGKCKILYLQRKYSVLWKDLNFIKQNLFKGIEKNIYTSMFSIPDVPKSLQIFCSPGLGNVRNALHSFPPTKNLGKSKGWSKVCLVNTTLANVWEEIILVVKRWHFKENINYAAILTITTELGEFWNVMSFTFATDYSDLHVKSY